MMSAAEMDANCDKIIRFLEEAKRLLSSKDHHQLEILFNNAKDIETRAEKTLKQVDMSSSEWQRLNSLFGRFKYFLHTFETCKQKGDFAHLTQVIIEDEQIVKKIRFEVDHNLSYANSPEYVSLCKLLGIELMDPDKLAKHLFLLEQNSLKVGDYDKNSERETKLFPIVDYINHNFSAIGKIPRFIPKISMFMFLWHIHMIQSLISQKNLARAKILLPELLMWQHVTPRFQYHNNHGPRLIQAFLEGNLPLFEKIARSSWNSHTGFGWDGKNTYEREIVYGMHAFLKGISPEEIMTHLKDKSVRFIDIQNFGFLGRLKYRLGM